MEYFIVVKANGKGDVVDAIGIREATPQDRLLGFAPLPGLYPSPEIRQALKELIAQAKSEELD